MKQKFFKKVLKALSNLQLSISLLFFIGIIIALGTVIEQDQPISFYQTNYPDVNPLFGFFTWQVILQLNLNNIYNAEEFIFILLIFCSSLIACTFTVQLPALKKFRLWKFRKNFQSFDLKAQFSQTGLSSTLVCYNLHQKNYHVFKQGKMDYAYTGLLGRVGPIIVHFSIILLLFGSTLGTLGGYVAQEMIPRGEIFHIQNLLKSGSTSSVPQQMAWRVNDFWITYTQDLKTNQFYSDLSAININGNEVARKKIFVNQPFIFNNLTVYQTDWDIIGCKVKLPNNQIIQVPLKKITKAGKKIWLGTLPLPNSDSPISFLINDLQGKLFLYNNKGVLLKECYLGDEITLGLTKTFVFSEFITSTGLQIKTDPGLITVYLAFFLLMCSIFISYISYSQIWGVENTTSFILAGKSNRAVLFFQSEFQKLSKKIC